MTTSEKETLTGKVAFVTGAGNGIGRLDCAFNNAGVIAKIAPTADSLREEWGRVIGVNLRGVSSCMKHERDDPLRFRGAT